MSPSSSVFSLWPVGRDGLTVSPLDGRADRLECCHRFAVFEIAAIPDYRRSISYRFVKAVAVPERVVKRL